MHGQLPRSLDEKLVDIEQSYRWLKYGDIKVETESTIVAAQDQAISTKLLLVLLLPLVPLEGVADSLSWCVSGRQLSRCVSFSEV